MNKYENATSMNAIALGAFSLVCSPPPVILMASVVTKRIGRINIKPKYIQVAGRPLRYAHSNLIISKSMIMSSLWHADDADAFGNADLRGLCSTIFNRRFVQKINVFYNLYVIFSLQKHKL